MNFFTSLGLLLARICLGALFIAAGLNKVFTYDETIQYMAAKGLTNLPLMYAGAVLVELIAGVCLLLGIKTRIAALVLALFLIPTTYIFHDFWNVAPEMYKLQLAMFLKNVGVIGGLLALASVGGGKLAFDHSCCHKKIPESTPPVN